MTHATWTRDNLSELRYCPEHLLESSMLLSLTCSLYLSFSLLLSPSLYLSLSLSNASATIFPGLMLRKYLSKESSPNLYPTFSLPHVILHPVYNQWSRKSIYWGIFTFQLRQTSPKSSYFQHFIVTWPRHMNCGVLGSQIWFRVQKILNHVHMRALASISFAEADHSLMIRYSGFAGVLDIWNCDWGI